MFEQMAPEVVQGLFEVWSLVVTDGASEKIFINSPPINGNEKERLTH